MMDFIYENQQRDLEQRIRQLERRYLATLREHPDTDDRAVNLAQIEAEHAELARAKASIAAIDTPATAPEAQALRAKAAEQRQIAANMRAQATADAILQTLPTDPTPDDHDAVAEKLEVAANEVKA